MSHAERAFAAAARPIGGLSQGALAAVAVTATLVISRLPEVFLRESVGWDTSWLTFALVKVAAALWLGSHVGPLRRLAPYFAVMTCVSALIAVVPVLFESSLWSSLVQPGSNDLVVILSERLVLAGLGVGLVAVVGLVGGASGLAYLRLRPAAGPTAAAARWRIAGPVAIVVVMALTGLAMLPMVPATIDLGRSAPFLVMATIAAGLNSFWEEAAFRALPMARLAPVVGSGTAIIILAAWFGLGHYYGGAPSGPVGAVMVGIVGIVLGRAMVDTRGLAWPWAIHFSIDLTIFSILALGVEP